MNLKVRHNGTVQNKLEQILQGALLCVSCVAYILTNVLHVISADEQAQEAASLSMQQIVHVHHVPSLPITALTCAAQLYICK